MHADNEEPSLLALQEKMIEHIKLSGLEVQYATQGDNRGLSIGGNIQEYMRKGILESDFIFAFFSPKFFDRSKEPVSGINTEINILTERFESGTLTCFIPIIISGNLKTSVPYSLRNLYAAQNSSKDRLYSIDLFEKELIHLLYYRIFKHSISIQLLLFNYLNQNSQSSIQSIYMSSLGSEAMPGSQGVHYFFCSHLSQQQKKFDNSELEIVG